MEIKVYKTIMTDKDMVTHYPEDADDSLLLLGAKKKGGTVGWIVRIDGKDYGLYKLEMTKIEIVDLAVKSHRVNNSKSCLKGFGETK